MKIITISGLDGSGKSTQLKLLKEKLENDGNKVFYFHAIDFSIGNKIFFWKHKKNKQTDTSIDNANWLNIQLRKIALYIDIWRFKKLVKKLEKQNYDYILSDRFFYDVIINIEYLAERNFQLNSSKQKNNRHFKTFRHSLFNQNSKFKIQNSKSIYLQTDPKTIMNRKGRIPDQGLEYLETKKKLYDKKTKIWQWKIINNTHQDKVMTATEIWQYLKNTL